METKIKSGLGENLIQECNQRIFDVLRKYYNSKTRASHYLLGICCKAFRQGEILIIESIKANQKPWEKPYKENDKIINDIAVKLETELEDTLICFLPIKYRIKGRETLRKFIRESIVTGMIFMLEVIYDGLTIKNLNEGEI